MEMDLVGIENQNEYYTNHYFTSIFQENAEDVIKGWKEKEKTDEIQLPWKKLRDTSRQYYRIRDRYQYLKNENNSKPYVQEMADLYLNALGYENRKSVITEVADGVTVPVFHEETKANGAPLLWAFLCVAEERGDDILQSRIFERSEEEENPGKTAELINDEMLAKLFFAGEEAPRFIILIGINQIALIDRNKWSEKRYLQFMMEDIFSRHEETTFMAVTVLLHKDSLCPAEGSCVLDSLDENSHKHSAGVSDALKYALRECIEILGNEVIYDMKTRQGKDLDAEPVDAPELTLQCLRYMYRFLFMLFIEARPELGYAPMKSQAYAQGYSLEGLRDVCDSVREASEVVSEGYYIDDTLKKLFHMTYFGYPEDLDTYKKAIAHESLHDVFTIEALKAHIFDPNYTKMITQAKLRNSAMLQIVDLMSISRATSERERSGRISYSALGINQMGAVYEALLSYRGFIAQETLYEVKRAGDKFNELDVGYFIPERDLDNYAEEERVRYDKGDKKGKLRMYEKGTFIYRLAGREREKSASYYTPEVLTKCLVKYALKELLKEKTADEILNLTICEPAMGSAAFLNEAINQLAEAYLNKKQKETGQTISFDQRREKLQEVKMFIADRNVYGVDLNPIAVELAEVSLWLNTIYKGAYVPWFGTQLVCGNSLIGARRQVYYTSKLENGKWYEEAPDRIMPGDKRKKTGVSGRVYHFLLGDPGMSNYTDKVIKELEPDNIKLINDWRKKFTAKYTEDDIKTLLRLSDIIDTLWDRTAELRRKVEKATFEPLSIFGHEEKEQGSHTTIREKDEIYQKLFKSEHMQNAGPYARLKAAMDYWCALWFWPIDKAELLPDRQTFFFEMSLILEGTMAAVSTNTSGQMSFVDSTGNTNLDETGKVKYTVEGSQLALEFKQQYSDLGTVNLDHLRKRSDRLALVNEIAGQQRFQHWELEFADVFADNGGFDLILGNPPWIKIVWNEQCVLSESYPAFAIKNLSASKIAQKRKESLTTISTQKTYVYEYSSIEGELDYLDSNTNYSILSGQQTNLYKCFISQSWYWGNYKSISAYIHPDGIYDDPNAGELRKEIYPRLKYHFQFQNEKKLFVEVANRAVFSMNIYANELSDSFDSISNLFMPSTIDECYQNVNEEVVGGIKNSENSWNVKGNRQRVISTSKKELLLYANIYDQSDDWKRARLPVLHASMLKEVLAIFAQQKMTLGLLGNGFFSSVMWDETNAQNEGIIFRNVHFPKSAVDLIYSGPHIGVGNPFFQASQRNCNTHRAFDNVCLESLENNYMQRCNYSPCISLEKFNKLIPETSWGSKANSEYRIAARKMLNLAGERTLVSCIIPPQTTHTNGIIGFNIKKIDELVLVSGLFESIPFDYFIKTMGKANLYGDNAGKLPIVHSKFDAAIMYRSLLLNCLSESYRSLWEKVVPMLKQDIGIYGKSDLRLQIDYFKNKNSQWNEYRIPKKDYERHEILMEIDVLVAMALKMTKEQLKSIYRIQFPVLQSYENDTWYDANGRIVFTVNRSLSGVGVDRRVWENELSTLADGEKFEYAYTDDTVLNGPQDRKVTFEAPFIKCNRENEYEEIWTTFEERFKDK